MDRGSRGARGYNYSGQDQKFRKLRLYFVLAASWIGYAMYQLGRRPFSVSRSEIEKELGIGKKESSVVDTSFLVMYTLGQLMYGAWLKDRWSSKQILVGGLLGTTCCCAALSTASSVAAFSVIMAANGAFQAAGWAACMCILAPWLSQSERGVIMGLWGTNMAAGGVAGNVLTSFLIGSWGSWRSAVLADSAVLFCGVAILQTLLLKHPNTKELISPSQRAKEGEVEGEGLVTTGPPEDIFTNKDYPVTIDGEIIYPKEDADGDTNLSDKKNGAAAPDTKITFMQTALLPGVFAISMSYFFHKLVRYALIYWLPYYFTKELAYSAATAGFIASFLDIGGVAGSIGSGIMSDRYANGTRRVFCCIILGAGMCLSLGIFVGARGLLSSSATFASFAAFSCGFFAFGLDSLVTGSLIQDYCDKLKVPQHLGAVSGFLGGVGTAGSILQGSLTAIVSESSWDALFALLLGLTVVAMCLMYQPLRMERSGK